VPGAGIPRFETSEYPNPEIFDQRSGVCLGAMLFSPDRCEGTYFFVNRLGKVIRALRQELSPELNKIGMG